MYRLICILLCLKNAPIRLQSAVDVILSTVKSQSTLIYLDDNIIFYQSGPDNLFHLHSFHGLLSDAVVLLKLKKCFFLHEKID